MKHCPKCDRDWPDKGKFCPMDGTPLVDVEEEAANQGDATVILSEDELNNTVLDGGPEAGETGEQPSTEAGPEPAPTVGAGKGGQPFSETKWFMAGDAVKDEEVTAEDKPVDDLQDIYKKTRKLPKDVRKKFSLKYGTPDDDQGEGDDGKS